MNYVGVVYLQVKLCDPHLRALEVRFSRRGAIQIYVYIYLYLTGWRLEWHLATKSLHRLPLIECSFQYFPLPSLLSLLHDGMALNRMYKE